MKMKPATGVRASAATIELHPAAAVTLTEVCERHIASRAHGPTRLDYTKRLRPARERLDLLTVESARAHPGELRGVVEDLRAQIGDPATRKVLALLRAALRREGLDRLAREAMQRAPEARAPRGHRPRRAERLQREHSDLWREIRFHARDPRPPEPPAESGRPQERAGRGFYGAARVVFLTEPAGTAWLVHGCATCRTAAEEGLVFLGGTEPAARAALRAHAAAHIGLRRAKAPRRYTADPSDGRLVWRAASEDGARGAGWYLLGATHRFPSCACRCCRAATDRRELLMSSGGIAAWEEADERALAIWAAHVRAAGCIAAVAPDRRGAAWRLMAPFSDALLAQPPPELDCAPSKKREALQAIAGEMGQVHWSAAHGEWELNPVAKGLDGASQRAARIQLGLEASDRAHAKFAGVPSEEIEREAVQAVREVRRERAATRKHAVRGHHLPGACR